QHAEAAITGKRDHLPTGAGHLCANCLCHGVSHGAVPERAQQPALTVHREIARSPHRRQADVAGEYGIACRLTVDRLGDLLRMEEGLARRSLGEFIERLARLGVMLLSLEEMPVIALFFEKRQQLR